MDDKKTQFIDAVVEYKNHSNRKCSQQKLLKLMETNDCREFVSSAIDGDAVANAFIRATNKSHSHIVQAFLDNGINPNICNQGGYTALMNPCMLGNVRMVEMLLAANANPELEHPIDTIVGSALSWACSNNNFRIVELLLQNNANPNRQVRNGQTALMNACRSGYFETVQLLLNYNADVDLKFHDGRTAIDFATREDIKDLIRNHTSPTNYVLK